MYTIKVLDSVPVEKIVIELEERLELHGRFTAKMRIKGNRIEFPCVRLVEGEPYYGNTPNAEENHPRWSGWKPKKYRYLSWDRWVHFNDLINDVLDHLECSANVWSRPQSISKTLWIRKEGARRETYSWDEEHNGYRTWAKINDGKDAPDEFGPDTKLKFPDLSEV